MSDDLFSPDEPEPTEDFRSKWEKAEKEKARIAKEAEDLRARVGTYEAEQRASQTAKAFQEAELDPTLSALFLKDTEPGTEISRDTAVEWARRYNLAPKAPEPEQVVEPEPQQQAAPTAPFVPMAQGQGSESAKISYEQYRQMVTDPARHREALELSKQGRVEGR